jgi:hypothetical protein
MPDSQKDLNFFTCSVSEDLYGVSPNANGDPLPTPGGGKWLPVMSLKDLGVAASGFNAEVAAKEIATWGCHWFTSNGPREIYWGPDGPPAEIKSKVPAAAE